MQQYEHTKYILMRKELIRLILSEITSCQHMPPSLSLCREMVKMRSVWTREQEEELATLYHSYKGEEGE